MNETETISIINKNFNTNLKLAKDKYSDYDAEDKNYICEIKNRRKYYDTKLIECVKLFKNYRHSQLINKIFIYVVSDEKGIFVYNITNNIDKIVTNKPTNFMCPINTDFGNSYKIKKYLYNLEENMSIKILF